MVDLPDLYCRFGELDVIDEFDVFDVFDGIRCF